MGSFRSWSDPQGRVVDVASEAILLGIGTPITTLSGSSASGRLGQPRRAPRHYSRPAVVSMKGRQVRARRRREATVAARVGHEVGGASSCAREPRHAATQPRADGGVLACGPGVGGRRRPATVIDTSEGGARVTLRGPQEPNLGDAQDWTSPSTGTKCTSRAPWRGSRARRTVAPRSACASRRSRRPTPTASAATASPSKSSCGRVACTDSPWRNARRAVVEGDASTTADEWAEDDGWGRSPRPSALRAPGFTGPTRASC